MEKKSFYFFLYLNTKLILVLIFCFITGLCHGSSETIRLISEAIKHKNAEKYTYAISLLQLAIDTAKDHLQKNLASLLLGECFYRIGNYQEAIKLYKNLLSNTKLSSEEILEVKYRLAQSYFKANSFENAQNICNEIMKCNNPNYKKLAQILIKNMGYNTNDPSEELKLARQKKKNTSKDNTDISKDTIMGIDIDNKYAGFATSNKNLDDKSNLIKNKEEFYKLSLKDKLTDKKLDSESNIKAEPNNNKINITNNIFNKHKLHNFIQNINIQILSPEKKETVALELIKLKEIIEKRIKDEMLDQIVYIYASLTAQIGEFAEACKNYDKILKEFSNSKYLEEAYFEAVRLRFLLGRYKAALEWGKMFLELFPGSEYVTIVKDITRAISDKFVESSKEELKEPIKNKHSAEENLENKKTIIKKGAPQNLSKVLTKQSFDDKNDGLLNDPMLREAKRKMKEGRYVMALRDFETLVRKYPNSVEILWNLALVQVQQEQHFEAAKTLEKLLKIEPQNNDARSLLAYCHYKSNNYNSAADIYESDGLTSINNSSDEDGLNFFSAGNVHKKLKSKKKLQ